MPGGDLSDTGCRTDSGQHASPPWGGSGTVRSLDPVFDALSHPRRRFFLYALHANPGGTLSELAEQLAEWRADRSDEDDVNVRKLRLSLFHTHVPKLVSCDVVEFDPETGAVTHGPNADRALAALAGAVRSVESLKDPSTRDGTDS